uniref:Replication-associated protein n=1 Tax=Maize streak dwarfing virus TaxID=2557970 RepID=A0A482G782_9GEMI|nr:RepA [Maize streak dwarfing virus]
MSAESITVASPPTTQQPTTEDVVFQPSTTVDPTQPLRRFAFKCANVFLTYSRCNLTPQEAGEHLWDLARPWTPAYICVSAELHQDGTPHLHALLQSIRPITTRDPLFFDMQMYHPNIKAARSSNRTRDYILKNPISTFERGTFIPRGGMDPGSNAGNTRPATRDQRMKEIMNSSTTKSEYLSAIQTAFPFEWATKLHHFEYSAERLFPTAASPFIPPSILSPPDLMCHERIEEWQSENLFQVHPMIYMLEHSDCPNIEQAAETLKWMHDTTREMLAQGSIDPGAYISSAQHEQERQLGLAASSLLDTTTGNLQ